MSVLEAVLEFDDEGVVSLCQNKLFALGVLKHPSAPIFWQLGYRPLVLHLQRVLRARGDVSAQEDLSKAPVANVVEDFVVSKNVASIDVC